MTRPQASRKQKKTLLKLKSNPFTALFAALAGAAMMVPVTAGVVSSSVHTELSGQLASLNSRLVQMQKASVDTSTLTPADIATVCGTPQASTGHVLGASVQTASVPTGGKGSGIPSAPSSTTFVKKIVTGSLVATATNSNTGPDSTNTIDISNKTTVTTTNDNDITLINHNDQHASSGDAKTSQNTTGGSTTTGDATNTNESNVNLSIKN